jgi:divalent metal cation (Fe/Co/Zn/Cd) transporter
MEPIGVAVFSVLMVSAFFQVFVEAVQRLFDKHLSIVELSITSIVAMSVTVAVKLVVFFAYRSFESASVKALSQDAKNDIVFNAFSLLFPVRDDMVI